MKNSVRKAICDIEREHDVKVLYACESGSRAWGFPSPDSDWDVRFIYAHNIDWHLRLDAKSDNIDLMLPGDLDLAGWELGKTLRLFAGCNLALNEWIGSPLVYSKNKDFLQRLSQLIALYFNPKKALFHYLSMAGKTMDSHLHKDEMKIKKFFYVLRPLLCCEWIVRHAKMPPTDFHAMLPLFEGISSIKDFTGQTLQRKQSAAEGELIEIPNHVKKWLIQQRDFYQKEAESCRANKQSDWSELNKLMKDFTSS